MAQLPSETWLRIFEMMDSNEMVKVKRVQRSWLEIIEQNRVVWRSLVLLNKKSGWNLSKVKLFDRKSQSSLREISIRFKWKNRSREIESFRKILANSKETLRTLIIDEKDESTRVSLCEISWTLPRLSYLKISDGDDQKVRLREYTIHDRRGDGLEVLWIPLSPILKGPNSSRPLDYLISLKIDCWLKPLTCRTIVEGAANTLKHLDLRIKSSSKEETLSPIELPSLRVVDIKRQVASNFPRWLRVSPSATLIYDTNCIPSSIPSVSALWLSHLRNILLFEDSCPRLKELRIDVGDYSTNTLNWEDLVSLLKERKKKVASGMEVDGVKMIPLQTVVISFKEVQNKFITRLKKLVKEVHNLDIASQFADVEL